MWFRVSTCKQMYTWPFFFLPKMLLPTSRRHYGRISYACPEALCRGLCLLSQRPAVYAKTPVKQPTSRSPCFYIWKSPRKSSVKLNKDFILWVVLAHRDTINMMLLVLDGWGIWPPLTIFDVIFSTRGANKRWNIFPLLLLGGSISVNGMSDQSRRSHTQRVLDCCQCEPKEARQQVVGGGEGHGQLFQVQSVKRVTQRSSYERCCFCDGYFVTIREGSRPFLL